MNKPLLLLLSVLPTSAAADDLMKCRLLENINARVACYDAYVDQRAGSASKNAPDAEELFGSTEAEVNEIIEEQLEIEQLEEMAATVTQLRDSASGKRVLTLDNGQVWRQLDNKQLRITEGDTVVIRKASLGSFRLRKQTGGRTIGVKRIDNR